MFAHFLLSQKRSKNNFTFFSPNEIKINCCLHIKFLRVIGVWKIHQKKSIVLVLITINEIPKCPLTWMLTENSKENEQDRNTKVFFQMSFALLMKKNINNTKLWTSLSIKTLFLLRCFDDNDVFAFQHNLSASVVIVFHSHGPQLMAESLIIDGPHDTFGSVGCERVTVLWEGNAIENAAGDDHRKLINWWSTFGWNWFNVADQLIGIRVNPFNKFTPRWWCWTDLEAKHTMVMSVSRNFMLQHRVESFRKYFNGFAPRVKDKKFHCSFSFSHLTTIHVNSPQQQQQPRTQHRTIAYGS